MIKYICTHTCMAYANTTLPLYSNTMFYPGTIVTYKNWIDYVIIEFQDIEYEIIYKQFKECFITLAEQRDKQIDSILDGE